MDRNGSEKAPAVPARTTQGAEARDWSWVEDTVWTERMVSARVNGVKGGRWYSLMDKVFAPDTLEDLVRELLRPMLKTWLDDNLPNLVERLVRAEIERVSRGR